VTARGRREKRDVGGRGILSAPRCGNGKKSNGRNDERYDDDDDDADVVDEWMRRGVVVTSAPRVRGVGVRVAEGTMTK